MQIKCTLNNLIMQEKNKYFWATKIKGILAKYKLLKEEMRCM